ncbi:hypothetical protein CLV24_11691 [Pontibacter ummariensis]|uniref:Uncharacterized protein n=1 Tax=Pontibacter ummariensis TaxID=1610492 RepID=A0A239I676_9BACT|nr:hypothetical protein [Pontibacter ummariensis]PRY10023.1 hypothetical protein CLV24_11691 [Pontibacter ummariensis]SNS89105.1 hypothetical protein SAMN06296052_1168 [Pontibacter ummariensis]
MTVRFLIPCLIPLLVSCSEEKKETPLDIKYKTLGIPASPVIEMDSLYYISEYLGESPADVGLWDTEPLQSRLKLLLKDEYPTFVSIMQTAQPLKRERVLYTTSSLPDPATGPFAFLLVDPARDRLHVSLIQDGKRRQFQTDSEQLYLPKEIREHPLIQAD